MKNTLINRIATEKIAPALDELNEKVVYIGGAVVSLYIDDPSSGDVRPTKYIRDFHNRRKMGLSAAFGMKI